MLDFAWRPPRAAVLSHLAQRKCTVYPAINKGWAASGVGLSTAEPAGEGAVSHWASVIPAEESVFSQLLNWRTVCSAQGCLLNSALPHRQVCREKRRKLISNTGRHLGKKSTFGKNPHRPLWYNAGEINGFLQKVFLQKFTKSAGKLWH